MRLPIALAIYLMLDGAVLAADFHDLRQRGYQPIWAGYASIDTCVHDKDVHQLGSFVFVCDQYTYEYPYHYGETVLLVLSGNPIGYICLEDEDDCIAGSAFTK